MGPDPKPNPRLPFAPSIGLSGQRPQPGTLHLSPAWRLGVVSRPHRPHQAERVTGDKKASGALGPACSSVKWVGRACHQGRGEGRGG